MGVEQTGGVGSVQQQPAETEDIKPTGKMKHWSVSPYNSDKSHLKKKQGFRGSDPVFKMLSSRKTIKKSVPRNNIARQSKKLNVEQKAERAQIRKSTGLGTLFGGILGAAAGFLVFGPVGALIGGVAGVYLGGFSGAASKVQLPDRKFTHIDEASGKPPHQQPWMKELLGQSAINMLKRRKPSAFAIKVIEQAVARMPQRMEEIRNSAQYKKSPEQFEEGFAKADQIVSQYVSMAKERAFPNVNKILDVWENSPDRPQSNEELRGIVKHCVDKADINSHVPLDYLRNQVSYRLQVAGEEDLRSELVAELDQCIDRIKNMALTTEQQAWQNMSVDELEQLVDSNPEWTQSGIRDDQSEVRREN